MEREIVEEIDESSDESSEEVLPPVIDDSIMSIADDNQCKEIFNRLKDKFPLEKEQLELVNLCLEMLEAEAGKSFDFGMDQILALGELAMKCLPMADEILGCSEYMIDIIDPEFPFEDFMTEVGELFDPKILSQYIVETVK